MVAVHNRLRAARPLARGALSANTVATLVILAVLGAGCASMINTTEQHVLVKSVPPGATATIDRGRSVTTPARVVLVRERAHEVRVDLDGFEPATVTLHRRPSLLLLVDAGFPLPIFGVFVDFASGGAWALSPGEVSVILQPRRQTEPPSPVQDPPFAP